MEPYRIKIVEPLNDAPKVIRKKELKAAGYNTFLIPAKYVLIDLISDSGTGAMSSEQWANMVLAREDFSGQAAYDAFLKTAIKITGMAHIQPVHQGRAAENILFKMLLKPGETVLSNTLFETTRDNIESMGSQAIDLLKPAPPFCGNIDIDRLHSHLEKNPRVRMLILTLTNNTKGGQPVALTNLKEARAIAKKNHIWLVFDASRFADNAYLNKEYSRLKTTVRQICRKTFDLCDILYMSSKKDGLVNIGGFIGLRDRKLFLRLSTEIIRQESYPSSGGLAARDIAAMNCGLQEAVNEEFLRSHMESIRYLAAILKKNGVRIFEPVGGHGIIIQPNEIMPYAAFALGAAVYIETGIRGGVFGREFRLALPRRVYTANHLKYAGEAISRIYHKKLPRLRIVYRPRRFFNFFAKFERT